MILNLDGAHPLYRPLFEDIFGRLVERYPWVPLKEVKLYQPRSADDHSMGNNHERGVIAFNAYWFAQNPAVLQRAALERPYQYIGGRWLGWHGDMVEEPLHVFTHEFAHVMADRLPRWKIWSHTRWVAATKDPGNAITGYSLDKPVEHWPECFAAVDIGVAPSALVAEVNELIDEHC